MKYWLDFIVKMEDVRIMLSKNQIKEKLISNAVLLKKYHVQKIGIFGSYARGEAVKESDIDLLVEFSSAIDLLAYVHLVDSITDVLHTPVDMVPADSLRPVLRDSLLAEVDWVEGI